MCKEGKVLPALTARSYLILTPCLLILLGCDLDSSTIYIYVPFACFGMLELSVHAFLPLLGKRLNRLINVPLATFLALIPAVTQSLLCSLLLKHGK